MKLRASFQRIVIVALTATLIAAIGLISIQARKANQANAISAQPTTVQPVRAKAKKANAFEDAKEASRFNSSASSMAFEPMMFAPVVTATKSAVRVVTPGAGGDVNGNGFVNPGDTLMYSVVVSNIAAPGVGNDALNVVFTDQLNGDLSLLGTATASPIATNDAYSVLVGNVSISVPMGSGLLANDVNPQGTGTIMASAAALSAQGGNVSVSADGSFTYNPPPGYEGSDTFTYTLTHSNGKMDTATVTLTISGMIWFVNNNAAACTTLAGGCGRLSNPFSSLAAFQALNNGTGNNPASGDNIFIFTGVGNYTGPLTLLSNQKLGGQGMTVSLSSFTGLTPPSFSAALPATSGTRPNILVQNNGANAHNLTLSTGNTLRGFNLENLATGMGGNMTGSALFGTSFNNLTASEMNIVSSAGTAGNCTPAVNLNQGSGTAAINVTLNSVSADKCTNGILLADTTGSFTITGNGNTTVGGNSSGGTIQNTTSHGISLSNTQNISLTNLNIQNSADSGIFGSQVVNFTFDNGTINNSGTSLGAFDSNIAFSDGGVTTATSFVSGTVTITDSVLTLGYYDGVDIQNFTGTISNLTISNNTITSSTSTATSKAPGIRLLAFGSAGSAASVTTATINGNTITNFPSDSGIMFQCGNATSEASPSSTCGSGANPINITNNNISGQSAVNRIGTQGILFNVQGVGTGHFNVSGNSVMHTSGNSISHNVFGDAIVTTTINNNTVVSNNTLGSQGIGGGTSFTTGFTSTPSLTVTVTNNNVSQTDGNGILMVARDLATGSLNISVKNNTVAAPLGGVRPGIRVDAGNATGDNDVCLDISGNTSAGSGGHPGIGLRKQGTSTTVNAFGIEGMAATASPGVEAFVAGLNPAGGGVLLISATSGFTNCGTAPIAAPTEGSSSANATSGSSNGATPSLFARVKQWLTPVFSAFSSSISYVNLDKAFGKVEPTVSAAEHVVPPSGGISSITEALPPKGGTTSIPARTMIVNSRGETRIVPTALLAGELITINGTGSGFTLPAGESTTIMFNATIGAGFTGTAITNQASVSGMGFGPILSNNLMTEVIQPPTISKAFSASFIATGTATSLTFTLTNPNPMEALTQVTFTDNLPTGLVIATPNGILTTCGGTVTAAPGGNTISFNGGTIAQGGSCIVRVDVQGTTEGAKLNTPGAPDSLESNPGANGATVTLNVINAPTLVKNFTPSSVPVNSPSVLSFTITNNSTVFPLNGIGFTDTMPNDVVIATPNGLTGSCGSGTITAIQGTNTVILSGGTLAANSSCSFSVNVTAPTPGTKLNSLSFATTELGPNSGLAESTLRVFAPPTVVKSFSPTGIPVNGTSTLSITITNPAGNPGVLNGIAISDSFPAGLEVSTPLVSSNTCGGTFSPTAGATSIALTGGAIATAGNSCTISVNVRGTTAGAKNNVTGNVSSTEGGTGLTASATLNVFAPPTIAKSFSPTSVAVGGTSTLTLTITNPAGNPAGITGVAVTDSFPAGLEVHTTPGAMNTCGGTFTAAAMATSISLTGGAIASAGGSCLVSVTVKATTGGTKNNVTGTVSSTEGGTGLTASATLSVAQAPTVTKSFSPSTVALNAPSTLTIQFSNSNAFPLTSTAITDSFPAGMEVDATPNATNTCGGTFNPMAGFTALNFSGGTIPANSSCAISVVVKSSIAGVRPNTTGNVSTAESGMGGTGTANLTVIAPPAFSKTFGPSNIPLGAISTLSFTITNNNTTSALNGIGFTDVLPAGLSVSDATTNNVCGTGSVLTVVAATRTITLTGGNLAIGSPMPTTCTIPVTVTGITPGAQVNTTQAITSTEGGTGSTATATLNVFAPTTITKSFSPTGVQVGGTSTLTITITNPAGNPAGVTGVTVSDSFPAGMEVNTTPGATNTCGGTFSPTAAATSISLTGGAIASAGASCSISVVVKATTAGSKLNTTGAVVSTQGGLGLTASATLFVAAPPTAIKSFSPGSIPLNGTSTLTISFTNPNAFTLNGLAITDSFPAGLEVAATPAATNTCGGTFSPTPAATAISLSGGSLIFSGTCSISVAVRGTTAGAKPNVTGNVSSTESGAGGTASAILNVFAPPTVSKVFVPTSVALNGQSTLNIVITNPAGNPGGLTGIAISDTFPAGLEVSSPLVSSNSCGGTFAPTIGATSISLTGGAIATAGNSCTISVNVRGTTAGAKNNVTGTVSSTEGGTGLTATATLNVFAPPTVTKAFSPTGVAINGTSTLTITITNPATNPAGITGVAISDTFPAGMEVHTTPGATNTCGGTFSPVAAATSINLTGGAIATAGGSCSISVTVRGTTAGVKNNVTGTVSSTEGGTGLTASATLTVAAAPTVAKSFSPTSIVLNGTSTLTISFTNPNAFPLTGLAITDSFPAGLEVAATPAAVNTCGGTFNPLAAATAISLSGGSLTSSGNCSISVAVKGTTAGAKPNITGNVSTTESGAGGTANATLNVFAPPTITKAFAPTIVALNGTSILTLTITNPAANPAGVTGVVVSDVFPAGLEVHTTPGANNTCGGSFAAPAGATNIALTGGAIATAGGSCSVSVTVRGTTPGAKPNTTGAVSSTEGGAGLTASATLNVFAPPTVAKSFSPNSIQLNNTSTLTITITNPATNSGGVTGVAINDAFPAGLEVDAVPMATNTCGGTFTAVAAATSINLTGGAIATAGGSCSISVKVKGTTQGLKTNTTGAVSSTEGGTGLTATATLDVITCNSIVCPSDVFTATTGNSTIVNYPAPTANGICGTITCTPASGSTFNLGTTTVTCNSSIGNQSCSFNVTVNRVGGTVTDPLLCTGPGNTVQATLVITNNGNVNQLVGDTTTFTNLVGVPGSCTVSPNVGTCAVTNGSLTYGGTLTPGQTVTITYLTQASDLAQTGQQVCTNNSVTFNGGAAFAFSVCDVVDCPAIGPGNPFPARSEASDQSAGSVLIYNVYTSSASTPNTQNTKVSLTNTHPALSSTVHLFFVDGNTCSVADSYVCLTANQTTSFLMSDLDPGTTGYLVAVATDAFGCPINFNYLIGDEYVKFGSGHAANLGAEAYSAIPGGLVACDQNAVTATINFDGTSYDRLAATLALSNIGSRADGNDTLLIVNRIGGNLGIGAASLGTLFGILYDDSENALSFNVTGGCQLRSSLTNNFPRTTPRFETFIPAGRTGWLKIFNQTGAIGMTGAAINFNANAASSAGAFNQGHNLHHLTLNSQMSYVIPIFPPSC